MTAQVLDQSREPLGIVVDIPEGLIAPSAKKAPDLASPMVMIHLQAATVIVHDQREGSVTLGLAHSPCCAAHMDSKSSTVIPWRCLSEARRVRTLRRSGLLRDQLLPVLPSGLAFIQAT